MPPPLQQAKRSLWRRQSQGPAATGPHIGIIVALVIVVLLAVGLLFYMTLKRRRSPSSDSKHIARETALRKLRVFRNPDASRGAYSASLQPDPSAPYGVGRDGRTSRPSSPSLDQRHNHDLERRQRENSPSGGEADHANGVDRNTSVRSVMTLPAYSASARPTEQIIAREGERGGVDTVIEYPEDDLEQEARREEEMESLYQIRRQRRQEQADREDRRRQRREARARGDHDTLHRLQQESQARTESQTTLATSAALIAEHQAAVAGRECRVSSVQYAALGVARHDGSRIRGNSIDSDNRPLLDSAASICGRSVRPSARPHGRSDSIQSVDTARNDSPHSLQRRDSDGFEVVSLERTTSRPRSGLPTRSVSGQAEEADIADLGLPAELPPGYDDPPDYASPVETRASVQWSALPPRLPDLVIDPSMEGTSAASPLSATGNASREPSPAVR